MSDDGMRFAIDVHERIRALPDDTALSHEEFMAIAAATARRHPIHFVRFGLWLKRSTLLVHVVGFMRRLMRSGS